MEALFGVDDPLDANGKLFSTSPSIPDPLFDPPAPDPEPPFLASIS